jgi:hypothetical protein
VIFLAVSRLTEILTAEAGQLFTEKISSEIWRETGIKLGLSAKEAEAYLALAVGAAAAAPERAEPLPARRSVTLRTIIGIGAATVGIAAAVAICAPFLRAGGPTVTIMESPVPGSSAPAGERVEVRAAEVRYPAGLRVTREDFLLDAGVFAFGPDGARTEPRLEGFEDINFNAPGEYTVRVLTGAAEDSDARVIAVIIVG